jgi:transcriptional regulator
MRANPFAILVSATPEGGFATHVPVAITESGGVLTIRGHVAKANPHWKLLEQDPRSFMIFHGPHSYVSTSNYTTPENVPTWNYGAVHAYGRARTLSRPEELQPILHELISTFERSYADQWAGFSESYRERMLSHIVGFEITVTELQAKFKLSQNRTPEEQANVIASLGNAADTAVSGTALLMDQEQLGKGKV